MTFFAPLPYKKQDSGEKAAKVVHPLHFVKIWEPNENFENFDSPPPNRGGPRSSNCLQLCTVHATVQYFGKIQYEYLPSVRSLPPSTSSASAGLAATAGNISGCPSSRRSRFAAVSKNVKVSE